MSNKVLGGRGTAEAIRFNLRRIRERAGFSRKGLSLAIGRSPSHVGMIERAGCYRRGPLPDMLEALAEALHVPVSELTREIPAKARRRA